MIRPEFADIAAYAACFTNPEFWRPYVAALCERHGLRCHAIRAGLPGTNAVFLVDGQYAVKLYPDLFGGARSYPAERECYWLITQAGSIPTPALIASGELFEADGGWPWPYLIMTLLPGLSLGESAALPTTERLRLAAWLGRLLHQIHTLPLGKATYLHADWADFLAFLRQQRAQVAEQHTAWGSLPPHLIAQLDDYLPTAEDLIDQETIPCLLHADLNADHVLGYTLNGGWQPTGIIDFGDARVGDPIYDLVALHLGLFQGDTTLLQACLAAYGQPIHGYTPRQSLVYTLLHEFNVLHTFREQIEQLPTLDDLAEYLWENRG